MTEWINAVEVMIGPDERAAVARVLESRRLVQGEEVAHFESEFAEIVGGRACVAVNSGTSALHLGLLAAGIGPGDEVIVPSFTFAATANSVAMTGATPVFADIDPATYGLDARSVAAALTPRTAAIMPVHLFGHPADMDGLRSLANTHGLLIVEDACQAHAASYDGRPAGALGDLAAFSFYATKNMTCGEGGMVVCRDEATARRVRLLRNQGMEVKYHNEIAGLNNRMTEMAAAIGRVQLRRLDEMTSGRIDAAKVYDAQLVGVATPAVSSKARHVYHQYTIRLRRRDELLEMLRGCGIDAAVYYPVPTHHLPSYADPTPLPETDLAAEQVLSLPMRPTLTAAELQRVVDAVNTSVAELHG